MLAGGAIAVQAGAPYVAAASGGLIAGTKGAWRNLSFDGPSPGACMLMAGCLVFAGSVGNGVFNLIFTQLIVDRHQFYISISAHQHAGRRRI